MNLASPILAAGSETIVGIAVGALAVVVILGIALWTMSLSRKASEMTFQMSADGLHINAPMYGKVIPRSSLKLDEARVVDLKATPDLKPGLRTNGIGMPGVRIGWFNLKNGARGLVYLYKTDTAVCVPTTEGYTLLLGNQKNRPEDILSSLKS